MEGHKHTFKREFINDYGSKYSCTICALEYNQYDPDFSEFEKAQMEIQQYIVEIEQYLDKLKLSTIRKNGEKLGRRIKKYGIGEQHYETKEYLNYLKGECERREKKKAERKKSHKK